MSHTTCHVINLGDAYQGVTLEGQLYDTTNTPVGSELSGFAYERGGGHGIFAITLDTPDEFIGFFDIYENVDHTNVLATIAINPAETDLKTIADAILRRGRSYSDGLADTGSLYEVIGIQTQSDTLASSGTKLTVYETDGTTQFNQRDLTLDAAALPVKAIG